MAKKTKIIFVERLRAIACLMVIFGHYLGSYWYSHRSVATEALFFPFIRLPIRSPFEFLLQKGVIFGQIGVGIFFIITGFLIPFSIKKKSTLQFLKVRFFRIYPVYLVSFIIVFFMLKISSYTYKISFPYGLQEILANLFLVYDWFYKRPFDIVTWTLLVQIKFYIIVSLFFNKKQAFANIKKVFFFIFLFFIISLFLNNQFVLGYQDSWLFGPLTTISSNVVYLIFIFLGVVFHNLYIKEWSLKTSFVILALSNLLFILAAISAFKYGATWQSIVINFELGLSLFSLLFVIGNHGLSKIIKFIASISYPLYLVHRINGYLFITYFLKLKLNSYLIVLLVFSLMVFISYLITTFVEKKFLIHE